MFNLFRKVSTTQDMSKELKKLRDWLIKKREINVGGSSFNLGRGVIYYQDFKDKDYFEIDLEISNIRVSIRHSSYLEEENKVIDFDYIGFIKEVKNRIN